MTQNFLELQRAKWSTPNELLTLGDVVRRIRQEHFGQLIVYVYEQAVAQKPLFDILRRLKLIS
ncbi:hypothetical protein QJ48_13540 [Paenibacillus sp. A3]|nr:hypothetical protein QJ48_13540 [Paenibacillus sp. A3]